MATITREIRMLIYLSQREFSNLMKILEVGGRSKDRETREAARRLARELQIVLGQTGGQESEKS